jgi:hypothetical protein
MSKQEKCWEEAISLNPMDVPEFSVLDPALRYRF